MKNFNYRRIIWGLIAILVILISIFAEFTIGKFVYAWMTTPISTATLDVWLGTICAIVMVGFMIVFGVYLLVDCIKDRL